MKTRRAAVVFLGAAVGADAAAQTLETRHPLVPSAGIASENGPGALWVNPANLGYDPDPRWGLFVTREDAPDDLALSSVAATVGIDGFGLGIENRQRAIDGVMRSDWALDYGTSVALPERVSVGLGLSWNLIEEGRNYLGYDLGLAWRPLPWLGLAGVSQNVGAPDPSGLARPRSAVGLALRPIGPWLVASAEYARMFAADPSSDENHLLGTVRLRPLEGLYVRGSADVPFDADGSLPVTLGAGIELYLFGGGAAAHVTAKAEGPALQTLQLGTDEPGESLVRSGRRVPELVLDHVPAYQQRGGLLGGDDPTWLDTLELLRRIEDDPGVRGLVVTLDGAGLGFARGSELRERLRSLEARGKHVLVYLTGSPSNTDFFVASAASKVALHPATDLDLVGLSIELVHYRGLFDLVGVEPQFVKRSDYKSAPESYTELEPTSANLEMTEALLDGMFGELVDALAAGRDVEPSVVRGWIDGGPHSAQEALDAGMVDVLLYPDELEDALEELHDGDVSTWALTDEPQPHSAWEDPQQIAIVYVEGAITSGESSRGGLFGGRSTGSTSVVRALDRAADDDQVRAVVLRVDSPGGSSFASDEIWRATQRLQQEGKPLVVSMGSMAASGGYYVSAGADAIWAEPTTLTGSIGVYSGKFAIGALQERLGVSTTLVGRGANASVRSMTRPWDDVQRARMEQLVDETYRQFKQRVIDGRALSAEEVEEVARGRVWTGAAARERGLVDELGGFQDAIADARARAGIPANRKVGLVTYSDNGALLQSLAPAIVTRAVARVARERTGVASELAPVLDALGPLDAAWFPALHPEVQVWALAPYGLRVEPR
ncbi:MAG: signal peptide peptidase SppA [Myxococcota bacterium]